MSLSFKEFLSYFPQVDLPFTLQEGSEHEFGLGSEGPGIAELEQWIFPHLPFEADEFTEIIPGVHWKSSENCTLIVFWAARLMKYSFIVYSYDPNGTWKSSCEVAGFTVFGNDLVRRMARVDDPDTIYVVEGIQTPGDKDVRPGVTRKWEIQILSSGEIVEAEI